MEEFLVIVGVVVVYALAIAGGIWFSGSADRRRQQRRRWQGHWSDAQLTVHAAVIRNTQKWTSLYLRIGQCLSAFITLLRMRRRTVCIALAILVAPAAALQIFAPDREYDDHAGASPSNAPVIAELLRGERLAPPSPMPPELFTSKEIERYQQQVAHANREWDRLDTDFRQRLLAVYQLMAKHGYQMTLLEGYRSPERQDALAKMGTHVTYAGAFQSYHQFGLAADSAFYKDGKLIISEQDPWAMEGYRLYGRYAEAAGLVWGGKWQMMDFGHVELRAQRTANKHPPKMLHF